MRTLRRCQKLLSNRTEVVFAYVFLLLFFLTAALLRPRFVSSYNLRNLMVSAFPFAMAMFAQTLVIITSGIDLSVGAVVSLSNVVCASLMMQHSAAVAIAAALGVGLLCGLLNGVLVAKTGIQPIIITLSTDTIISGIALYVMGAPGGTASDGFASFFNWKLAGFPMALFLLIVVSVIMWLLLNRTRLGRSILAIGGNESSAYSSGVNVARTKILTYTIAGVLSAVAGIFLVSQMYSGDPTVGENYTMKAIIMAAIGGTSLSGGKGSVIGGLAGVFIMCIINNLLNLMGISTFYQFVIQGVVLIASLMLGTLQSYLKSKRQEMEG